jgi:hypothetical protein
MAASTRLYTCYSATCQLLDCRPSTRNWIFERHSIRQRRSNPLWRLQDTARFSHPCLDIPEGKLGWILGRRFECAMFASLVAEQVGQYGRYRERGTNDI